MDKLIPGKLYHWHFPVMFYDVKGNVFLIEANTPMMLIKAECEFNKKFLTGCGKIWYTNSPLIE